METAELSSKGSTLYSFNYDFKFLLIFGEFVYD